MSRLARGIPAAMRTQGSFSPLAVGICLVAALLALAAAPAARAVTVGGWDEYDFDNEAFADYLDFFVGTWRGGGAGVTSLEDVLVGPDAENLAYCDSSTWEGDGSDCQATLLFTNEISDLLGPDLIVFELGIPGLGEIAEFGVGIADVINYYESEDTGENVNVLRPDGTTVSYDLRFALIDLADFFEASGGSTTLVDLFPDPSGEGPPAQFTVIASMNNVVPEPSTVMLLGMGLVGLAMNGRRPRA